MDNLNLNPSSIVNQLPNSTVGNNTITQVVNVNNGTQNNSKIDRFVGPVLRVITGASGSVYYFTASLFGGSFRFFSAAQVVFYRLIFSSEFNPVSKNFKARLDLLEGRATQLNLKLDELKGKFLTLRLITQDIKDLRQLRNEIQEDHSEIKSYFEALVARHKRFPIQDQLDLLMDAFDVLKIQLDKYCLDDGERIFQTFKDVCLFFAKERIPVLQEIRDQVQATWSQLEQVFDSILQDNWADSRAKTLFPLKNDIKILAESIVNQLPIAPSQAGKKQPLFLSNIGNSCYMDSALHALLSLDTVRDMLSRPLELLKNETATEYQKRLAIQKEICLFIDEHSKEREKTKNLTLMEYFLALQEDGPSLLRLREAVFKSGLHPELSMDGLKDQQDAASIFELLIDHLMKDSKFQWRAQTTAPNTFPGLYFKHGGPQGKSEELAMLQVPMRKDNSNLEFLLRAVVGLLKVHDCKNFNPLEGIEHLPGAYEKFKNHQVTSVIDYVQCYRFTQLPPVLMIQIKRFNGQYDVLTKNFISWKNEDPVILPKDGIVDLTPYHSPVQGPKTALYRIKSMVKHLGNSLRSGHYVSEVEIAGKYFHCDDIGGNTEILDDPTPMDAQKNEVIKGLKTAKDKFLGNTDPYIIVLERIPDDEADTIIKSRGGATNTVKTNTPDTNTISRK